MGTEGRWGALGPWGQHAALMRGEGTGWRRPGKGGPLLPL